ncbi:MAG: pentapeptide repeat-containing protein [Algicola sp.]|nr:pentapeptide repeat-containing protein [Algicola sp.]
MKTPSELKSTLIAFIKHLYHSDASSSSLIHWWWLKRLIDLGYKPTLFIIYVFNYIPPFSWIYHAFEGIFGKNGYIGVGSVAGLYIAIYGVAQSSNQDELDRQERGIEKYETAMKLSDEREKMHGMKGLVALSAQAIQLKPVFRCPIKFGDCETFWFELAPHRLDLITEELSYFLSQCHKEQNCNQSKPLTDSQFFNLSYLNEDKKYITYNQFATLIQYILDPDSQIGYGKNFITFQLYSTITPLLDLQNLEFKSLDISRWQLNNTQMRNTVFNGVSGEYLDMSRSVYRKISFKNVDLDNWISDGSLIYNSSFSDSNINVALLRKGVSFEKSTFANSHISFNRMHNVSFRGSSLLDTSITVANLSNCAVPQDFAADGQSIIINDIKQRFNNEGLDAAVSYYRKKLRCNMILPNGKECRFISRNRCLTSDFQILDTLRLNLSGSRNRI